MRHRRGIPILALLLAAQASFAGALFKPGKVTVHYYRCELDGTDQPYSMWVPRDYGPGRPWPLFIQLHGLGGSHRIGGVRREIEDCLVASPDGRGATDYKLWGELDIIRVLEDAEKRYNIDPDRVYLYGVSMGGSGSWQLGVHFPGRFAALGPVCGNADHRVWEELWQWGEPRRTWMSPRKDFIEATESPALFAENLFNLPSWCLHGARDNVVPADHSRSMVEELDAHGCLVVYTEDPGAGHGVPGHHFVPMLEWMKEQRRNPWPKRVVFRTAWRRHPGAYWVRIHRFERPFAFARVEAVALDKRSVRVETANVEEFALHLVPPLFDRGQPIRIELDGEATERAVPPDGWLRLRKHGDEWRPSTEPRTRHKTPDLEGPITHAFMTPFVVVFGTQGKDERAKRVAHEEARILADRWNRWARGRARLKADRDVKDEDIANLNLILVGDPATNSLIPRVMSGLPIRVEPDAVVFGDRRFEGDDVGVKLCYPNPLNPERYVVLFSGTTWRGVYEVVGRFGNWFDWGILDGWHWQDFAVFDNHTYSPETFLAVGFFDNDWKLNPAWTVLGDERLRMARPLRKTAPHRQPPEGIGQIYLSDLEPAFERPEKGVVARDRSFNAFPLRLGDRTFERGLGVHPNCDLGFDLHGRFPTFEAVVGSDLEGETGVSEARDKAESFEFMVIGDGRMIYQTGRMRWSDEPRHIYVPIPGVRRLELKIHRRSGPRWLGGPVDWAIAKVGEPIHNSVAVRAKFERPERLVEEQSLDGAWRLASFPVGEGIAAGAHRAEAKAQAEAIAAIVPGSVFAALDAAGQLEAQGRDATSREWWYWRSFDVPRNWEGRSVWLELDGAAYQADAWLNGRWIGRSVGPYARGRFDATQGAKLGERNALAIRVVASPAAWAKTGRPFSPEAAAKLVTSQELARSGYPPLGLWQPVRLKTAGPCLLRDLHVESRSHLHPPNVLRVEAELQNLVADKITGRLTGAIRQIGLERVEQAISEEFHVDGYKTARLEFDVVLPDKITADAGPEMFFYGLWWPTELRERGERPILYRLDAAVAVAEGVVSDHAGVRFGVRTVALDAASRDARLLVNGRPPQHAGIPLGIRGAVWLPADGLLRLDAARYRRLLERAREAGFNTLRVWGGGLAETDAFYDLCDEMGFLVLQELPLTGDGQNPDDFLANCAAVIRRLRSHPSLVAWCVGGSVKGDGVPDPRLTADVARLCGELDPQRRLIADSPRTGQAQIWTTRTDPETRRTYWRGASIAYTAGVPSPSNGGAASREAALKAQLAQAAAVQRRAERRRAAPASEILWQLNEPLPSTSPAFIGAAGTPKPAWYALRRARAPLALFADCGREMPTTLAPGEALRGEVCVESLEAPLPGALVRAAVLDRALRPLASWQTELDVPRGVLARPLFFDWSPDRSLAGEVAFLHLRLDDQAGEPLASNVYWFGIVEGERQAKAPRLRVAWLGGPRRGLLADEAFLAAAGIELERPEAKAAGYAATTEGPQDEGGQEAWNAAPSLQLDGYDVLVVDAATAFDEFTDADLRAAADAVAKGAGLLVVGRSDDLLVSSLEPLLPFGYPEPLPTGVARCPVAPDPTHPALARVGLATCPLLGRRPPVGLRRPASVLLHLGAEHPLLAETAHQRGRVVQWAGRSLGELAAWPDYRRFVAGLLGYLGRLPHPALNALVDSAAPDPLRGLGRLGPALVEASVRQDGDAVVLELANASPVLAFGLVVEAEAEGPAPPLAFSDNGLFLLPGERRAVRVAADPAAVGAEGEASFRLSLCGWNVAPRRLEAALALRDGRVRVGGP